MKLSVLLNGLTTVAADVDRSINTLTLDSRRVTKGALFIAVKGTQLDGSRYVTNAISQGAAAVLVQAEPDREAVTWQSDVPVIAVENLQAHVALLGARFYDEPSKKLKLIGVTGTNGKTSCTHFIAQTLQANHIRCGVIGTLGSGLHGQLVETGLTTPDSISIQKTLHDFVLAGAQAAAIEVSSHAIDQGRINELDFEIGVFTNLTQDHLDYHGDMQTYANVKRRFLEAFPVKHLVINMDDVYGAKWAAELGNTRSVYTYSMMPHASALNSVYLGDLEVTSRVTDSASPLLTPNTTFSDQPDSLSQTQSHTQQHIYCEDVKLNLDGIHAHVFSPWGNGELQLPLIGQFNLSNALAALATLCINGMPFANVLETMRNIQPVPGRMQQLGGSGKPVVVVDYAHTPDALDKVLQALRSHTPGKLICVFGCGGDRDPGKRALMAAIAEARADVVIVTNDNPRHEAPEAILHHIMEGFEVPEAVDVELDRAMAIKKSIQSAGADDCVLIAGKGAEHYQQIGDEKFPFDDVLCAKECLN